MFGAVPGFSLFSKTMKPRNWRSDSAMSLERVQSVRQSRYYSLNEMHIPPHSLSSKPCQTLNGFASNSDDTEPISSVIRKHIIIIVGDCKES